MKTLLTLLLLSVCSIAFGQSGSFPGDSAIIARMYDPRITICNEYTQTALAVTPSYTWSNASITKCVALTFSPIKSDDSVFDIDEMKDFVKRFMPKSKFEEYVRSWRSNPINHVKIVEASINCKGWKEDYTFNEFRKLIYE